MQEKQYQFDELSDEAKEKAREVYRQDVLYSGWWTFAYDDATRIGALIGIAIDVRRGGGGPAISFQLDGQGCGVGYSGTYSYQPGCAKAVRKDVPKDKRLHSIVDALVAVQKRANYNLMASVSNGGYRDLNLHFNIERIDQAEVSSDIEQQLRYVLSAFADWIHGNLQMEADYLHANEQVDEALRANEYEFNEYGE